jgi:hypothetical protein
MSRRAWMRWGMAATALFVVQCAEARPQPAPLAVRTRSAAGVAQAPPATTQGAPQAVTLPPEYGVLQTRNPFAHGKPSPGGPKAEGGPGAPGGPETLFVLKGVIGAEGDFTAFVEDTTAKRVVELGPGAPLGPGRIKSIDVDAIEYESAGTSRRIEVGQDLAGHVAPPTPTSKPAGPQPPPGDGPPPGPPGGPMPGPGPGPGRGGPRPQPPPGTPEPPPAQ